MKQKFRLIISSCSLAVTSLLLVLVMFAWYATNKVAYVTGGTGMTANDDYQLTLQRGTYNPTDDSADSNGMVWINTANMAFSNISPGNVFYFRIKIEGDVNAQYKTYFGNVTSSLVDGKLKVSGSKVCLDDGFDTELYTIISNKVTVDSQTLYNISGSTITLDYYLIHNVFYVYDYGTTEMAPTDDARVSGTGVAIPNFTSNIFTMTSDAEYYYFALEFNEEASVVSMPDGTESSNCYLYQKIYIGNISVDVQK